MAVWSKAFRDLLDGNPTEGVASNADGQYRPRFRMIIGTPAFTAGICPHFEDVDNVLVAYSHDLDPAASFGIYYPISDMSTVLKVPHAIGRFSISPQEIAPRSWQYTSPQLQMEISPEFAAVLAKHATPGSLMSMQCNLAGEVRSTSYGNSKTTSLLWSDIYFGQFRNLSYSGGRYSITCRGFVEAAVGRPTVERALCYSGKSPEKLPSTWSFGSGGVALKLDQFNGVGSTVKLRDSYDGTDSGTSGPGALSGLIADEKRQIMYFEKGFGQYRTDKGKFDSIAFGPTGYEIAGNYTPFYGYAAAFVKSKSTGSKGYYVSYGMGATPGESLGDDMVTDTWLKSADDRLVHASHLGTYETTIAGSDLSSRVFLNGNPAIELATLLYSPLGWSIPFFTMGRLFHLHSHNRLIEYAADVTGSNIVPDEFSVRNYKATLMGEIKQPASDLKSFVDSIFGGIGVFPVFKAGGLGVNCVKNIHKKDIARKPGSSYGSFGLEGEIAIITIDDVQSIDDQKMRASGFEVQYQKIKYTDEGKSATATISLTLGVTSEYFGPFASDENPTEPCNSEYVFKAGAYNTKYPDLIANDFKKRCSAYWRFPFGEVSLTLRSLKYAYLCPGDLVYLNIPREGFDFATPGYVKQPSLGILHGEGTQNAPCTIIRHSVNWLSGTVSITVIRQVDKTKEV